MTCTLAEMRDPAQCMHVREGPRFKVYVMKALKSVPCRDRNSASSETSGKEVKRRRALLTNLHTKGGQPSSPNTEVGKEISSRSCKQNKMRL